MNHVKSSTADTPSKALAPSSSSGTRQSYLFLAVGIIVALALPFLLQSRGTAFSAAPASAMSGRPLPTSNPMRSGANRPARPNAPPAQVR